MGGVGELEGWGNWRGGETEDWGDWRGGGLQRWETGGWGLEGWRTRGVRDWRVGGLGVGGWRGGRLEVWGTGLGGRTRKVRQKLHFDKLAFCSLLESVDFCKCQE